jgi:hypothetical protein
MPDRHCPKGAGPPGYADGSARKNGNERCYNRRCRSRGGFARGLRAARGTLSGFTTGTAEAGALSDTGVKYIWRDGLK